MSDIPPPQPPISSSGPVPPGAPGPGAPFGQSPFGQAPVGSPPPSGPPGGSWQPAPGGGWSPASQSSGGGAGVKIAVVVALVAVVALAVGAVFVLGGGDDDEPTTSAAPEVTAQPVATEQEDDEPAADTVAAPETAAPAATEAPTTAPPLSVPGPVDLFADGQARDMIAEVAAARGADPLRILKVAIYPTYSFVQVQDPSKPENVDEYAWRDGRLQGDPAPVRLMGDGDLEANLLSGDEVRWNTIPRLVAGAVEATGVDEGEVTHVIVQRDLPFSDAVVIRVYVNGPRESGFLEADANGDVIEVNVS